jgi:hypothetical protein
MHHFDSHRHTTASWWDHSGDPVAISDGWWLVWLVLVDKSWSCTEMYCSTENRLKYHVQVLFDVGCFTTTDGYWMILDHIGFSAVTTVSEDVAAKRPWHSQQNSAGEQPRPVPFQSIIWCFEICWIFHPNGRMIHHMLSYIPISHIYVYYIILYYIKLYYIILYYITLCYVIYYVISCYIIIY